MNWSRKIVSILFVSGLGHGLYAQEKSVDILYSSIELVPTFAEVADALNIKVEPGADSVMRMYAPDLQNVTPVETARLRVFRVGNEMIKKIKMATDTLESEFDMSKSLYTAIRRFKSFKKDSIIRIEMSYMPHDNEFFSYTYFQRFTEHEKTIAGYPCKLIIVTETVRGKLDNSCREWNINAWVTNKIIPSVPIQSILLLYENILPDFTLLEAIRSPEGPGPHRIAATQVVIRP